MSLTLVTWNTQSCCGIDGMVDVARIVAHARALADFDVLCLQEIAIGYPELPGSPSHDQPALLRSMLPGFEIFFGVAVDELGRHGQRQRFGNLIAARCVATQVEHHALPYPADGGVRSMPRMCSVATVRAAIGGTTRVLRVMNTHLEYYSPRQRMAQARAVRALHAQACAHAVQPPQPDETGSPFQTKLHTRSAILCGDFNFVASGAEYALLLQPPDDASTTTALHDAWPLVHGKAPQPPTFQVFDRSDGPEPLACDFVFVSADLAPFVRRVAVDSKTQASDHQPVIIEFD
jgi:endonuclease/exonuclease/phosphatase family metal-dependent hydrolase